MVVFNIVASLRYGLVLVKAPKNGVVPSKVDSCGGIVTHWRCVGGIDVVEVQEEGQEDASSFY